MVVTYQYACTTDGGTEIDAPMGSSPETVPCPVCSEPARRVFSQPMISAVDQKRMGVIDRTKASSDTPDVVTSLPGTGHRKPQRMAPPDPRLQKLPRP
jgi:hypothetical protein